MALFDFINKKHNETQSNQQQQNTNGNQNTNQNNQNTNQQNPDSQNGIMANNGNNGNTANPLDQFKNLFDNKEDKTGKAPSFTIPDDKLNSVVDSLDFMQGLDPALMQKATNGDSASLIQLMNSIGKNAYKTAMQHNSQLTDAFTTSRLDFEGKSLSSKIKNELTQAEFGNSVGFDHPVVKQQLSSIAALIQKEHPDASPAEVAKAAREYITQVANAINPKEDPEAMQKKESTDWGAFIEQGTSGKVQ